VTAAAELRPRNRILTIPNLLSVARLGCIPVFLWLMFGRDDLEAAAWLLGGVGATDWVDGYIARHFGQVSELGKVLDPTADRLVLIICGGAIILDGDAPTWFSVLVIGRELVVGGGLALLTAFGMKRFDVKWVGKAGTFALFWAFPLFVIGASDAGWADVGQVLGYVTGIPGLVLSYYAAYSYIPIARRSLREGREARAA
jgi:cardiolipin synthase